MTMFVLTSFPSSISVSLFFFTSRQFPSAADTPEDDQVGMERKSVCELGIFLVFSTLPDGSSFYSQISFATGRTNCVEVRAMPAIKSMKEKNSSHFSIVSPGILFTFALLDLSVDKLCPK